jgi:hypothetical protein
MPDLQQQQEWTAQHSNKMLILISSIAEKEAEEGGNNRVTGWLLLGHEQKHRLCSNDMLMSC